MKTMNNYPAPEQTQDQPQEQSQIPSTKIAKKDKKKISCPTRAEKEQYDHLRSLAQSGVKLSRPEKRRLLVTLRRKFPDMDQFQLELMLERSQQESVKSVNGTQSAAGACPDSSPPAPSTSPEAGNQVPQDAATGSSAKSKRTKPSATVSSIQESASSEPIKCENNSDSQLSQIQSGLPSVKRKSRVRVRVPNPIPSDLNPGEVAMDGKVVI